MYVFLLVLSPIAAIGVAVYLYNSVQARGSYRGADGGIPWADVTAYFLGLFFVLYSVGMFHMIGTDSDLSTCSVLRGGEPSGIGLPGFVGAEQGLLPVKATCRWADGVTINRVPGFVNPGLAFALCCTALSGSVGAVQFVRGKRARVPVH